MISRNTTESCAQFHRFTVSQSRFLARGSNDGKPLLDICLDLLLGWLCGAFGSILARLGTLFALIGHVLAWGNTAAHTMDPPTPPTLPRGTRFPLSVGKSVAQFHRSTVSQEHSFTGAPTPPILWIEVPCFHEVTGCASLQSPLREGLRRRVLSGKDLRGVWRSMVAAGPSFWSFLFSHYGETRKLICK
jgi:hypothetical protein